MLKRFVTTILLVPAMALSLEARLWTDVTGNYTLEADMIGFDDKEVVVQRADGELAAFKIEKLSKQDQAYLKTKDAQDQHAILIDQLQMWHLKNGLKVTGRVVDFAKHDVTVQQRRGKVYVNHIAFDNLPPIYQSMLPLIAAHMEPTGKIDKQGFKEWVAGLEGMPRTFKLSGVLLELENGDEYGVPFFLFSDEDQKLLSPGWKSWQAARKDPSQAQRESFKLQSAAAAYRQGQQQSASEAERRRQNEAYQRQVATINLQFQAIQAGLTSAWEVTLYPLPGTYARPRWVVAYGRNSLEATQNALRANPGFRDGPVRKLSR